MVAEVKDLTRAGGQPTCPICGRILDGETCFNLWCPVGLGNVQRELALEAPPVDPWRDEALLLHDL